MLDLIAIGPGIKQRWRRRLVDGETVRLGRSPDSGWSVPWDMRISRDHADIHLDGDRVHVRCLRTARNAIYWRGEPVKEFYLAKGEDFRIGHTVFRVDVADGLESQNDMELPGGAGGSIAQLADKPLEDRLQALLSRLEQEDVAPAKSPPAEAGSVTEEQRLRDEAQALRAEMEAMRAALRELEQGEKGKLDHNVDAACDADEWNSDEDTDSDRPAPQVEDCDEETDNDVDPHEGTRGRKEDTVRKGPSRNDSRDSEHVILADFKEALAAESEKPEEERDFNVLKAMPAPPPLPPRVAPKEAASAPTDSTPIIERPVILNPQQPPTTIEPVRYDLESELGLPDSEIEEFNDTPPFTMGHLNGNAFANYELLDQIFRGGSGQILKAVHRQIGRTAAIKLLSAEMANNPESVARFHLKAKLLGNLQHPNIIAVYDSGQIENTHYLIMEYVNAQGIVEILREQERLDLPTAIHYMVQIAEALDDAHQFGIVHRNVHPGHLLIDRRGKVKLIGWGMAMHVRDSSTSKFERPGRILGLVDYISPEQIMDSQRVDARADIYALGCTMFAILAKRVLYPVEWQQRKITAQRFQPAPRLRDLRPDVPESFESILQKMLAKERGQRFRSMRELVIELHDAGLVSKRQI